MSPRRPSSLPLPLPPRERGTPAHRWLYAALRAAILGGRLRPGARLPASRDFAVQTGLSRGTVVRTFEQLASEGYTAGTIGSGTYVSAVLPDDLLGVDRTARGAPVPATGAARRTSRRLSEYARRVDGFPGADARPLRAFRANQPATDLFPTTLWAQVASRRLRRATSIQLVGCGPMGYPPLQDVVADYLRTARGVRCDRAQVAIVSGAQEALDIATRLFVNPGDRVCIEDPGYVGASLIFEALGAKISPVAVDDEGMRVPTGRAAQARLAYVTPAHQYPLGISMSLARRLALLEWASTTGALIVEDDYDSEYRYSRLPLPALQGLDAHGCVLFVGSFSKVLFPSLRLGYLVVPPDLVDRVAAVKSVTSRHAPVLDQATLCDFIGDGHFGRHVRRMREIYAERLTVLIECATAKLGGLLDVSTVEAGLQTIGWLRRGRDGDAVARAAALRDVEVVPLGRFARGRMPRDGLQLGFAAVDAEEIRRGVDVLARVLNSQPPIATRQPG